ncbi:hypothetical protein [Methanolobus vulcani]|uniref:Uncharacterized protein n=1 Tax=Methanolobus vulcani TaxID=38026 RepID=A0A7Z8P2C5_9EURY|nr:hypothetical protein [Methanolobus vulcani]TQD28275.1 hypothetical protein FKV42_00970 [Methanolobus vulcani]
MESKKEHSGVFSMASACFYQSSEEIPLSDMMEIKAQHVLHGEHSLEEQALLLYKIDVSQEDPLGFYTCQDLPDKDTEFIQCLNADLKHWLIFYGAPEPCTLAWWTVVVHHRDRTTQEKCASIYHRYVGLFDEMCPNEEVKT